VAEGVFSSLDAIAHGVLVRVQAFGRARRVGAVRQIDGQGLAQPRGRGGASAERTEVGRHELAQRLTVPAHQRSDLHVATERQRRWIWHLGSDTLGPQRLAVGVPKTIGAVAAAARRRQRARTLEMLNPAGGQPAIVNPGKPHPQRGVARGQQQHRLGVQCARDLRGRRLPRGVTFGVTPDHQSGVLPP
jgi:hypothetical protein